MVLSHSSEAVREGRRFAGYSGRHRKRYIAECRDLRGCLVAVSADDVALADTAAAVDDNDQSQCCPKCQARMRWISFQRKPRWLIVMRGPHRPHWYRDG